jgi:hypothetical protein
MFSQLLKLFPRTEFQELVKRTHEDDDVTAEDNRAVSRPDPRPG